MSGKLNSLTKADLIKEGEKRNPKVVLTMKMLKAEMINELEKTEIKPSIAKGGRRGEY